jgi:hypothetical protein
MNEYQKFKKLLEYFVAHLEYCVNNNPQGRGYTQYNRQSFCYNLYVSLFL